MNYSPLDSFLLKGFFTTLTVQDLQNDGLLRNPEYNDKERKDHDLFVAISDNIRSSSLEMRRYFRMLYVYENLVRQFIIDRFTEEDGENWFDKRASRDMKKSFEKRKKAEEKNKWHIGRNKHPIFYLDFGDLALLIINNWKVFSDFFPDQSWIKTRISETERSRNIIAHTNRLDADEGVRLEMHLRDWISQIG